VRAASDEAPGRLELVRLFENTVDLPDGPDRLELPDDAAAWCRRHGLPPVSVGPEAQRLREFREALREVLFANNGEADAAEAWNRLRPFAEAARLGLVVDAGRGLDLMGLGSNHEAVIASLLAVVHDAIEDGTWSRLRACRKSSCRFAYYDHTKNGSRAWCSMATCGNQAKAQRRRVRERLATD
jgi:predicted RNA-binding Zn ribbon-like protein